MKDFIWEQGSETISKALNYAKLRTSHFQIWQTIDGKKVIMDCRFKDILDDRGIFKVITHIGASFNFSEKEAVFCKFNDRGLMFKCRIVKQTSSSLHLSFPEEIVFEESRNRERDFFGELSSYYCDLSFSTKSLIKNGYRIFDLCPSGICILIENSETKYFEQYKELFINSIQDIHLSNKTECTVKHIAKAERGKTKVGIQFSPKLCVSDYLKIMEAIL